MKKEIVVPAAGESVTEADIASWAKSDGDYVEVDEQLLELETDKASLPLNAEIAGILNILVEEGETVKVGDVIGMITASDQKPAPKQEIQAAPPADAPVSPPAQAAAVSSSTSKSSYASGHPSPAAAKAMAERGLEASRVQGSGKAGRITKQDVQSTPTSAPAPVASAPAKKAPTIPALPQRQSQDGERGVRREKMSRMRRTIAGRLVEVQQTAALLTTFNEVDMTEIMALRKAYKDPFKEKYQVGLGFMSFFTKATSLALQAFPIMNAQLDDDEIVYHDYCDIGIAVSTPKGLVVPVVRDAEYLSFAEIEQSILNYALRGRAGQLTPVDMEGGTFTITNGGTFGSMMSTPIVNQPQSAILGMHNIVQRPMAVNGEVKIRPVMYLAVSYDHRIIDGSDAVQFLVRIKDLLEDPRRLLIEL